MTRANLLCAAALAAALSACTVNNNAAENGVESNVASAEGMGIDNDAATPSADDGSAPSNDSASSDNAADGNATTPPPTSGDAPMIPAQYRGRWGMVPLDCTGDPSAAKGLIEIDSKTIKFYEARATLKEQRPAIATSFTGEFAFTGEGMEWTKVETLTRTGDLLKRADKDGTYNYTRCR